MNTQALLTDLPPEQEEKISGGLVLIPPKFQQWLLKFWPHGRPLLFR